MSLFAYLQQTRLLFTLDAVVNKGSIAYFSMCMCMRETSLFLLSMDSENILRGIWDDGGGVKWSWLWIDAAVVE